MPFLDQAILQLRSVEWASAFTWDIQFTDAPAPFDKWFPASDVEEPLGSVKTHDFSTSQFGFSLPEAGEISRLKVTFYDNDNFDLLYWFEDWVNNLILNRGDSVTPLKECVRQVTILKLNQQRTIVRTSSYYVFPLEVPVYHGKSESGAAQFMVDFVIAGRGPMVAPPSNP